SRLWNDLGTMSLAEANPKEARAAFEQAQALKVELGDNYGLAFVYGNMAKLLVAESRDIDGAVRYCDSSLTLFRQFHDQMNVARVLHNKALLYELAGKPSDAAAHMTSASAVLPANSPLTELYAKELKRLTKLGR